MTNLKLTNRGAYRYRTGETGNVIEVEVYYDKGGANYFSGGNTARGVRIAVRPIEIKEGSVSFLMFSGIGSILTPLARKNDKALLATATKLDGIAPEIALTFEAKDGRAAIELALAEMAKVAA